MAEYQYREQSAQYATDLYRKVWEQARLRLGLEERWYFDTLQYLGRYDPSVEKKLAENESASKLFVNLTRPKTRILRARLIDILFPTDEANWDIEPTPVPRIERAMERLNNSPGSQMFPLQQQETDRANEERMLAKETALAMRKLIRDQLIECDYVDVGRSAITQACKLGCGVMKGPIATDDMRYRWKRGNNGWRMDMGGASENKLRPRFQFVDLWDFYPEMDAASMKDCEFVFQLHRMSPSQLRRHAKTGMFHRESVKTLLEEGTMYSPPDTGHFIENLKWVRQLEAELDEQELSRYLIFEYHGPINYEEYKSLAEYFGKGEQAEKFKDLKDDVLSTMNARVWFSSDQVLRFSLNPLPSGRLPYSVFRLDPSENNIIGSHGVPRMLRDPQSSLNATWRMCMESGGLSGVPMFAIDTTRVEPVGSQSWQVAPRKVWRTKPGTSLSAADGGNPIQPVPIAGDLNALIQLSQISRGFMDDEANLPLIAQGDQGAGAKQTAHGMTLLANAVNVLFRDGARGFDEDITRPNMTRIYEWNMEFSDDETVKGDMEIKPLGSSVLLVNEIVSQNILMLMNLVAGNPDIFAMLKFEELVRLWFRTLRLDRYGLIKSEAEIKIEQEEAARQPPPVDPAIEAQKELEMMKIESQMQLAMVERENMMMKLAQEGQITVAQLQAMLATTKMKTESDERKFLAETAIKERHGTGI